MRIVQGPPAAAVLLTPTRDRPEAFRNAEHWMSRQDFDGDVVWVVVDDGEVPVQPSMGQVHLRRKNLPDPSSARGTLVLNLLHAIPELPAAMDVIVIEDDDWYSPGYVRAMVGMLRDSDLVGYGLSRYYNLRWGWGMDCNNRGHASLCSTGFSAALLPWFRDVVDWCRRRRDQFVDLEMWRRRVGIRSNLILDPTMTVGIKGYPGSPNIGIGKAFSAGAKDPEGRLLTEWIGAEDAAHLIECARPWRGVPQPGLEPKGMVRHNR